MGQRIIFKQKENFRYYQIELNGSVIRDWKLVEPEQTLGTETGVLIIQIKMV